MKNVFASLRSTPKRGSILVFSLIIFFMMLLIVVSISAVAIKERKTAGTTEKSTQSFQAADSGSEVFVSKLKNYSTIKDLTLNGGFTCNADGTFSGSASKGKYKITMYDTANDQVECSATSTDLLSVIEKIKVVGIYDGTSRAIEVGVQNALAAGSIKIIGSDDADETKSGNQNCEAVGKTCAYVFSTNRIADDAHCRSSTSCIDVCERSYNQNLTGVENGPLKDNIHSCNALLGEKITYLESGIVRCNGFFSAVCY